MLFGLFRYEKHPNGTSGLLIILVVIVLLSANFFAAVSHWSGVFTCVQFPIQDVLKIPYWGSDSGSGVGVGVGAGKEINPNCMETYTIVSENMSPSMILTMFLSKNCDNNVCNPLD